MLIGQFLHAFFRVFNVIFGNTLDLFEAFVGVFAYISNADAAVLAFMPYLFYQLLPSFFSKHGHVNDDLLPVILWVQAQVGRHNGFLDFRDKVLFPGLNKNGPRIGRGNRGHLDSGHTDPILSKKGQNLWFEFRKDRDVSVPKQLTQGIFGVSRSFPAGGGSVTASCTVTPETESVDLDS